jgi:hypothetical protein
MQASMDDRRAAPFHAKRGLALGQFRMLALSDWDSVKSMIWR